MDEKADIVQTIEAMWKNEICDFLTNQHGLEIKLLVKTFQSFQKKETSVQDLLFEAKAVLDCTWEKLNVGKWSEVPEERKQVYAIASFIQIIGLLHEGKPEALMKSLEVTDLGILLGLPIGNLSLTKVADVLSSKIESEPTGRFPKRTKVEVNNLSELVNEIETVYCPSLDFFRSNYFTRKKPVKLMNIINHWPALHLWSDLEYIVKKAGPRTVPIELGKHYADGSYSQKLMKVSEFVEKYLGEGAEEIGYLAQHQLFDQVPELKRDITEPDYCVLSENPESSNETEINAWFGPKGTVSPLHFDPKHNLLCQVVGTKKITLYSEKDTPHLYPHEGSLLFNTSRVDVENPDLSEFPDFEKAKKQECLLNPGEVLYIPPKYWHHVRSLENSFSVSFWWE